MPTYRYNDPYLEFSSRTITSKLNLPRVKDPKTNLLSNPFCGYNFFKGCGTDVPYFQPICAPDYCSCAVFRGDNGLPTGNLNTIFEVPTIAFQCNFELGTDDFNIQVAYEHKQQNNVQGLFAIISCLIDVPPNIPNAVRTNFWSLGVTALSGLYFDIRIGTNYLRFETASYQLAVDNQYEIRFVRTNGQYFFFINGTEVPFAQVAGTLGVPSNFTLGGSYKYLYLGMRSFQTINNLSPDVFGIGALTGSICNFKIDVDNLTVHQTNFDCHAFQLYNDLWRDIVFGRTPTSDEPCYSRSPECDLIPDGYDPAEYAITFWDLSDPVPPLSPAYGSGTLAEWNNHVISDVIHLLYPVRGDQPCPNDNQLAYSALTSPQYSGFDNPEPLTPSFPSNDFDSFVDNMVLINNLVWANYNGTVFRSPTPPLGTGSARIIFITKRSTWSQFQGGSDICEVNLRACYRSRNDGSFLLDPFNSDFQTFCCDVIAEYDDNIDIISRRGSNGSTWYQCNKPFKRAICGDYCNEDTTSCKVEDIIEFQFNLPDQLNNWEDLSPKKYWHPDINNNDAWGTVEAYDFETHKKIEFPFDFYVDKHVVGVTKYRTELDPTRVQIVKINPYFLPCKFYFKFILRQTNGGALSFYTEPFEKITCVGNTVVVEGFYPDGSKDCIDRYYGTLDKGVGNWDLATDKYSNKVRVHGEIVWSAITIETETQKSTKFIKVTRTNTRDSYKLRTQLIPPYMVDNLKFNLTASEVLVDGFRYTYSGTIEKNNETGLMWAVDITLQNLDICQTNDFTCN